MKCVTTDSLFNTYYTQFYKSNYVLLNVKKNKKSQHFFQSNMFEGWGLFFFQIGNRVLIDLFVVCMRIFPQNDLQSCAERTVGFAGGSSTTFFFFFYITRDVAAIWSRRRRWSTTNEFRVCGWCVIFQINHSVSVCRNEGARHTVTQWQQRSAWKQRYTIYQPIFVPSCWFCSAGD